MPGEPTLWPKLNIEDADGTETNDNGDKIYATTNLQGIQPKTIAHVFLVDEATGEEVYLTEGRLYGPPVFITTKGGTAIQLTFTGSASYLQEIAVYMIELAKSLGISSGDDWGARDGTSSTSSIVTTLKTKGLSVGILELLKEAGLDHNLYLNLVWRMLRLSQRLQIVDNPKSLGYFQDTNLGTLLDKTIGQASSTQSIANIIMYVLQLIRYLTFNIPAPSFLNAKYVGPNASTEITKNEATSTDPAQETDPSSPEEEQDVLINSIANCTISNSSELEMNDWVMIPEMAMAPPPRCNVIFPIEYQQLTYAPNFDQRPTRSIGRLSGRAALQETSSDALVFPESLRSKYEEYTDYTSAEEKYRGIILSQFNMDRPEYLDDLGSDYIKGYLEQSYELRKWTGSCQIAAGPASTTLNLRAVPGFPALILQRNGQHLLAHMEAVNHSFDIDQGSWTSYTLSTARPYDAKTPVSGTAIWNQHAFFDQKSIGIRVYPLILGKYFETIEGLNSEEADDLSILKHLYTAGMSDAEVSTAKSAEDAVANAVDSLWEEYKDYKYPDIFAYNYGRRIPITREHLFENFYEATMTTDKMMVVGGYTLETNSLSVAGEDQNLVIGQNITEDTRVSGCFVKERQDCYIRPAATMFYGDGIARSASEALDILIAYDDDQNSATNTKSPGLAIQEETVQTAANIGEPDAI